MSRGINKVFILGNLGNAPEIRATQSGSQVATLSVATDESYKDKQTGQLIPKTEWHRIVLFNRLAEIAQQYLKKGAKVFIEGKIQTRKWQDNNGQDRYTTEIVGHELQMLDSVQSNNGQTSQQPVQQQQYQQPVQQQQNQQPVSTPVQQQQPTQPNQQANNGREDDIPF